MSSIPYYNQSGPFWDFVAELQEQGPSHPWFGRRGGGPNRGGPHHRAGNPWGQMRPWTMPMRGGPHAHGHGPGHGHWHNRRGPHAHFATPEAEMRDPTPEPENENEVIFDATEARKEPELDGETLHEGVEGRRHGPGARRGAGPMAGRGRGRGLGLGGRGRGGMGGGPRARRAGFDAFEFVAPGMADEENAMSGNELPRGPGARRGGKFAGRGRGVGARAAGARSVEGLEATQSDSENQQSGKGMKCGLGARRAARLAGKGPKARAAAEASADAEALIQSDGEKTVSGDERPRGPGARRGWGMAGPGRGRGAGMGRGGMRAARAAAQGHHEGVTSDGEGAGFGPRGPHRHHHGPHGPHGLHGRRGMRRFGPMAGMFAGLPAARNVNQGSDGKFTPEVDVFDHAEAFIVHVAVPGAKKKDVEVNWDAEKSALNITGTINRSEDEEILKTIAMSERKVGPFERMVRLGSRASPAQVDVEGITAKIEDGVLKIEVPKLDSGYVEIKKVDII